MKRSQLSSPTSSKAEPEAKKAKLSPNPFASLADGTGDDGDGWTKVEKRKQKKAKKPTGVSSFGFVAL